MRNKIISIALLFFVLVLGGCSFGQLREKKEEIRNDKQITDNKVPKNEKIEGENELLKIDSEICEEKEVKIITSDVDISDWKTYRNEELGFEVRYPKGWFVNDGEYRGNNLETIGVVRFQTDDSVFNDFGITIIVNKTPKKGLNYQNILKKRNEYYKNKWNSYKVNVSENLVIQFSGPNEWIWTYFEGDTVYYQLNFSPAGVLDEEIYNIFLLSFKIIK